MALTNMHLDLRSNSSSGLCINLHYLCYLCIIYAGPLFRILGCNLGPPSVNLSCVGLSEDVSGAVNVTVSWTLSGGDSADFYLISITTNAPQTPYGGLVNITNVNVTQYELTGFITPYEYNITIRGVNCGSQEGAESEPLTITPQGKYTAGQ